MLAQGRAPRLIRFVLAGAALMAAGAVVIDCGLIIGAGNYQIGSGCPAGSCDCGGFVAKDATCGSCLASSCCAEGSACRDDDNCKALYDCVLACKPADAACRNACRTQHSGDGEVAVAFESCLEKSCTDSCASCGGVVDWYADECSACVATTCCDSADACAKDDACAAHQRCYRTCKDPTCPIACDDTQTPGSGGVTAKTQLDTCLSSGCGAACKHGAHWDCVGKVSWPVSDPSTMITYTLTTVDFVSNDAFPAADVRACSPNDYTCASPVAHTTADSKGVAKLKLPAGFNGYLDVTGPMGSDVLESLVYLSWPLTADYTYENLGLGSLQDYTTLLTNGGGQVLPDTGAMLVITKDCLGIDAADVSLSIMPYDQADQFYFVGTSPVAPPSATKTTATAVGGFANVTPATITLKSTLPDLGGEQSGLMTVQVRSQQITWVTLTPTE